MILAAALTGCGGAALPSAQPREVEVTSYYDGLDLSQYIALPEYRGVEYTPYGDPGRTTAELGDTVTVESSFTVEGETEARELVNTFVLGDSGLPDEFDEMFVGAKPGEEVSGTVSFEANDARYGDLTGKTAQVTASIMVLDLSYYRDLNASEVFASVTEGSRVLKYPEDIVAMYENAYDENYRSFAAAYSMELDDYLNTFFGFGEDELESNCREAAEWAVREDMVMYRIWELEKMSLTEEDLENCHALWLQTYGYETEEDMPVGWDDSGVRQSLINMTVFRKVKEFLLSEAKAVE